jgi:hypothetical protein
MSTTKGEVGFYCSFQKRTDGSTELVIIESNGYHPFSCRVSRIPAAELPGPQASTSYGPLPLSAVENDVRDCFLALERLSATLTKNCPARH